MFSRLYTQFWLFVNSYGCNLSFSRRLELHKIVACSYFDIFIVSFCFHLMNQHISLRQSSHTSTQGVRFTFQLGQPTMSSHIFTSLIGFHSPLSRLVNSSCCFSFHSFFGFIRFSCPSHTRSTKPPCLAMTLFTRLAKSMADSFSSRVIGGRYQTSHTIAHEVIIMYRYCIIEYFELFQNASPKRASYLEIKKIYCLYNISWCLSLLILLYVHKY